MIYISLRAPRKALRALRLNTQLSAQITVLNLRNPCLAGRQVRETMRFRNDPETSSGQNDVGGIWWARHPCEDYFEYRQVQFIILNFDLNSGTFPRNRLYKVMGCSEPPLLRICVRRSSAIFLL